MADNKTDNTQTPVGGEADGATQPQAGMLGQYIKDLSFENPNAPASFQNNPEAKPSINVNVNVGVSQMNQEVYEVELKLSVKATSQDSENKEIVAFICELAYGGLFGIRNVPEDQVRAFLLIQAPTMMFPFARRIVADSTRDGGFPPIMLDPINFTALYQQQAQKQAGADAATPAESDGTVTVN